MTLPDLPADLTDNSGEPVFNAPWEAQVFAMVVKLHEEGHFTWPEWADILGEEISNARDSDNGKAYYSHMLTALEKMTTKKDILDSKELVERKEAWDKAARNTPHGQPIELEL